MSYIDGMRNVFQAKLDHMNRMDMLNMARAGKSGTALSAPPYVGSGKSGGWVMAIAGLAALAVALVAGSSDKNDTGSAGTSS